MAHLDREYNVIYSRPSGQFEIAQGFRPRRSHFYQNLFLLCVQNPWFRETGEYTASDAHTYYTVRSSNSRFSGVHNCHTGSVCGQKPLSATSRVRSCQWIAIFIISSDA